MTTIDYNTLEHHPVTEKIVHALAEKVGKQDLSFFRLHVAYYMSVLASMMRCNIQMPGDDPQPVSLFAMNLAPSGYGKGHSTAIIEDNVINEFQTLFTDHTFPILASQNLPALALKRSARRGTDHDVELTKVEREFQNHGTLMFSFDSATAPAVKQLRNMLLMANAGSMNLQTDEIGSNLQANKEVMMLFLELFDGKVKNKLVKNTTDSIRTEEIIGITPTNMMLFGVASGLLDGGKIEEELIHMFVQGYARRFLFSYIPDDYEEEVSPMTPEERLAMNKAGQANTMLEDISKLLGRLSNVTNAHRTIPFPDETALLNYAYEQDCAKRAKGFRDHDTLHKAEMRNRFYKTQKYAGVLAFIDNSPEVTPNHYKAAMALAEDSGEAFGRILARDKSYVRLAKYLSTVEDEVTLADMDEDLTFFKGTKQYRDQLITQAIAWGYRNNIVIKRRYTDGIEFYKGDALKPTDMNELIVSHSPGLSEGYDNDLAPWDLLHHMTQAPDLNWINHHVDNGHRHDDHIRPGFNLVVIDVDNDASLDVVRSALRGYKALIYTTKRHTDKNHRFRIVMPTNYELRLNKEDFKEFMKNLFEWLPFDLDTATGQRSRKWLSHDGEYEYLEGDSIDVLPFIPKTVKNDERKRKFADLQNMDNLERWVMQNTADGNRNNQLLRFGYILVDGGLSYDDVQKAVFSMNAKLPEPMEESEMLSTMMSTFAKAIANLNV